MSEYRERATGLVKSKAQVKRDNPNVSLPSAWTAEAHDALGVDPVLASPKPAPSGDYKLIVRDGVEFSGGNWVQAWKEVDQFPEYTTDEGAVVTEAEQIAAYEAQRAAERRATMACTPRQARLALASQGLYEAVQTTVVAISDQARIEWEYATTVERTSPLIDAMKGALGMTDEDLDNLFELAVTL